MAPKKNSLQEQSKVNPWNGVKYYTIVQLPTNIAVWKQFEQYDSIP